MFINSRNNGLNLIILIFQFLHLTLPLFSLLLSNLISMIALLSIIPEEIDKRPRILVQHLLRAIQPVFSHESILLQLFNLFSFQFEHLLN